MLLEGKKGVIIGVANKRSLAWGIAQAAARHGAKLAFSYQGERLKENVDELASLMKDPIVFPLDVTKDEEIAGMATTLKRELGEVDFLVHAVAFARREDLEGRFVDTSRAGYLLAQDVSSYSLTAVTHAVLPLMEGREGSIVTLSYLGGERVVTNYNVMGVAKAALEMSVRYLAADLGPSGVRVNAISAGPVKTLAAAGIHGFGKMLEAHRSVAPLRRNVTQDEVGDAGVFLLSSMSRGITGEVVHVDAGYHVLGFVAPAPARESESESESE
jgi:enoyl-[acyl-carrier protein] reductase I